MTAAIDVRELHFRYGDGREALRGVSFVVNEGESVALIGPNGAGKSTLLLHLNGILPERMDGNSSVSIFGVPVRPSTLTETRRKVGLLFQDPDDQLFCPTVFEDVAFGPQQAGIAGAALKEIVQTSLARVGLHGFERRSPHHLSGGEKQRVCLAGILACNPIVLALDEPTGNLDPRGKRELMRLLKSLQATTIIATHDLELVVQMCDRTIVLDEGVVVADGDTVPVLSDERMMLEHGLERPHSLKHLHPHD